METCCRGGITGIESHRDLDGLVPDPGTSGDPQAGALE
jgi:hypothetical protein